MNEYLFLVRTHNDKFMLFDKENFLKFCNKEKRHNWQFYVGNLNNKNFFKSSKFLKEEDIFKIFTLQEIKPLLKYKQTRFGNTLISDMAFFMKNIHLKYGEKIPWNDKY